MNNATQSFNIQCRCMYTLKYSSSDKNTQYISDSRSSPALHICLKPQKLSIMFTLVCVRHGEAQHNLATPTSISAPRWTEEGNLDTPLTDRGREQAAQVSGHTNHVTQGV